MGAALPRRELLNHAIALSRQHFEWLLREYSVQQRGGDAPEKVNGVLEWRALLGDGVFRGDRL